MLINDTDHRRLIDVEDLVHVYWPPSKDRELAIHLLELVLHKNDSSVSTAGRSGCPGAAAPTRTTGTPAVPTAAPGVPEPPRVKAHHL